MSNGPAKGKATRKAPGPKSFYLVYEIMPAHDGSGPELTVHEFSRKTDEVLSAMSDHDGAKVKKLISKPGR